PFLPKPLWDKPPGVTPTPGPRRFRDRTAPPAPASTYTTSGPPSETTPAMRPLALLAAAPALRLGAQALTLGQQGADPDGAPAGAGVQEACLAALGLPSCPRGGAASPGCLDYDLLAEDMGELGFDAEGCARALQVDARVKGNPLANTPHEGQVPRANVSHTKPVIWVHIHKSMGIFIYSMALLNHENVVRPSFNGNWWPYDTPDAVRRGKAWRANCSKRAEYFAWSNVTWAQVEHEMDDYNLCHGQFNYGILLRDPSALAISKASMEKYSPEETIASLNCLVGREGDSDLTQACDRAAPKKNDWKLWWFYDNFLVRTLGGQSVWSLPAGGITEEHAHKAIERLSKFEVVMFADDFENKAYLETAIGWRQEFYNTAYKRPSTHVVELTNEQKETARFTNRFDYMVLRPLQGAPHAGARQEVPVTRHGRVALPVFGASLSQRRHSLRSLLPTPHAPERIPRVAEAIAGPPCWRWSLSAPPPRRRADLLHPTGPAAAPPPPPPCSLRGVPGRASPSRLGGAGIPLSAGGWQGAAEVKRGRLRRRKPAEASISPL
ncbi:unnamed protein product, partial [Prorocentrum cordatum]